MFFAITLGPYSIGVMSFNQNDIDKGLARMREEWRARRETVTESRDVVTLPRDKPVTRRRAAPHPKLCPYCNERPLIGKQESCSPKCRKRRERALAKKAGTQNVTRSFS